MHIEVRYIETDFPNWIVVCDHIKLFVNAPTGESIQCSVCDIQYALHILKKKTLDEYLTKEK